MINFRVMLDISSIYKEIRHLKLKTYNSPFPMVFVSAQDPDDACHMCISELIKIIMDQDASIKMRIICKKLRRVAKIDKVYILS